MSLVSSSTHVIAVAVGAVAASFVLYAAASILRVVYAKWKSPLHDLRGPPSISWVTGSVKGVMEVDAPETFASWTREYGPTLRFKSFGNMNKLLTVDLKAINHVLTHSMEFYKSDQVRFVLHELLGDGLLAVEGPQHRLQRKMLSPAFGTQQIRSFTKVFFDKSLELRDVLLAKTAAEAPKNGEIKVDIFDWLSRVSLDIIGLTGFDYAFDSLTVPEDQPNELYEAVRDMMAVDNFNIVFILSTVFPPVRLIPSERSRVIAKSYATIRRVCGQVVAERKAAVIANLGGLEKGVEKSSIEGRDLMSLLIKANLAVDVAENARLSDDDLISQIPTLILAGHETTSTSLSWTLLALCRNMKAQDKLRAELCAFPTDTPTMEELNAFPYLDAVVREALRLHNPVSATERVAVADSVIPADEYVDKHGNVRHEILLNKGDTVFIPIYQIHTSTELWGDDAKEFKPERWEHVPEAAKTIPGVYHPLLAFIAGPHACIGYRFSLLEAKAILFTLIRAFEFDMAVPDEKVVRRTMVVGRPHFADDMDAGPQLPLLIRPVRSG
ncbi:cytochrome P450 [Dentipellis sp. KUC8613]|nr:cytochrome P450 [Dentipellis sp. KUC8613]